MYNIQLNPKRTLTISLHEIQRFSGIYIRRFFQSENVYKEILCHDTMHVYKQHIERDDLQNYLLGLYPTKLKGEKWYHRIFYHMFNCCCPQKKE